MDASNLPAPRTVGRWILRRSVDLIAVAVIVLIAGELYLRSEMGRQHDYAPDPELGAVLRPGQVAGCGRLNADGHRGPDTDWTQPVLLALGDSQAFGLGVADDEVWTARLAKRLEGIQVVNAAHPGFGPYHQCVRLRRLLDQAPQARGVLVRVSIEDRNFQPPATASIPGIHVNLERTTRIREYTRMLPFLKQRGEQQWAAIASLIAPGQGEAISPREEAVGEAMWQQQGRWWNEMVDLAEVRGVPILFFVHDPTDQASSAVLERRLNEMVEGRPATVLRLGSRVWGLKGDASDRLWRDYHARFTQQHDHHGNAPHHEIVARVVAQCVQASTE